MKTIKDIDTECLVSFCFENSVIELDSLGLEKEAIYKKKISQFRANNDQSNKKYSFVITEKDNILGLILFERLEFDSNLFNVETYRITDIIILKTLERKKKAEYSKKLVLEAENLMKYAGAKFIHCKLDSRYIDISQAIQSIGYNIVSEDVTLAKSIDDSVFQLNDQENSNDNYEIMYVIKSKNNEVAKQVSDLSGRIYTLTRFHQDHEIPKELANRMQELWAKNCFEQGLADEIIAVRQQGQLAGFVAGAILKDITAPNIIGRILLIAVDEKFQGKGVGKILNVVGDKWFRKKGCTHIVVGTQLVNIQSMKYYQKSGFSVLNTSHALHKWII